MSPRPPASTLGWLEEETGRRVLGVRALDGATTSALHVIRLEGADGTRDSVVLRRYALRSVLDEDPGIVRREVDVLGRLEPTRVPAPHLLAADVEGVRTDVPAVVMSRVAGRVTWGPDDLDGWLAELVDLATLVHATPVGPGEVQRFQPYAPATWAPPPWFRHRAAWDAAIEVFHGPRLDPADVFLHRDLHPGNVLWRRGRVSGLVDWPSASIGPPSVDLVHCRTNVLVRLGVEAADRLEAVWAERTGRPIHPWVEVVMLVDAAWWTGRLPRTRAVLDHMERLLGRAVASLGR